MTVGEARVRVLGVIVAVVFALYILGVIDPGVWVVRGMIVVLALYALGVGVAKGRA